MPALLTSAVEPAQPAIDRVEHGQHCRPRRPRRRARRGRGARAPRTSAATRSAAACIARVVDGDVPAARGQQTCGGCTDAAAGAGDQGDAGRRHGPFSWCDALASGRLCCYGQPRALNGHSLRYIANRWSLSRRLPMKRRTLVTALPGCLAPSAFHRQRAGAREAQDHDGGRRQEPAVLPAADDRRVAGLLQGRGARGHDRRLRRRLARRCRRWWAAAPTSSRAPSSTR